MPRNTTTRQPRLALYSHAPSDSINLLKDELVRRGVNVVKVKRNNSTFVGRQGDILFNYGSSSMPTNIIGQARVLNNPARLEAASNKLRSFQRLQEEGIPTVEWT
ncbi:ATP-grasp domain-containing protein, partial [Herbiconiux daphne]